MSPRSEELMDAALDRRRGAEVALEGGAYALAVSAAYDPRSFSAEEAGAVLEDAEAFVEAVARLLEH